MQMEEFEKISSSTFDFPPSLTIQAKDLKGFRIDQLCKKTLAILIASSMATLTISFAASFIITTSLTLTVMLVSSCASGVLLLIKNGSTLQRKLPQSLNDVVNYIQSVVAEIFILLPVAGLYMFRASKLDSKIHPSNHPPVLIIHGYLHNSSAAWYLRHRFENAQKEYGEQARFGSVFSIDLGSPFHSLEEYAELVKEKVEEIKKITGRSDIILVAHSMGGLVSFLYALTLATEGSIKQIITLGSPLEGTHLAPLGIFGECAKQMRRSSEFILNLAEGITHLKGIGFCHIGSKTDIVIRPYHSAIPNHHGRAKIHEFDDLGHLRLLFDDRVADAAIDFMQTETTS